MESRPVRELRILLPSIDEADLTEVVTADPANLRYRRVGAADWSRLRLEGISITGCRISGTTLRESVWEASKISGSLFEQVDLSSARLEGAKLDRTHLIGCRLSGVALTESTMSNVLFENCRLDYATFRGVRTTGPVAFINCTLTEASLSGCRWSEVVLDRCRLTGVELDGSDLRGTDLRGNPLDSIRGLSSLRGTTITVDQLSDLTRALVSDLELHVSDPPSSR